jgi:UDP-GlcNAc:undecaprenyl-phosphate/decaprenyl-phosphate GlcNAc-1-phosphate transferase
MIKHYFAVFAICAAASFLLTPIVRKTSHLKHFLDKPSRRKLHRKNIPTLGGLAIYLSFIIGLILTFNLGALEKSHFIGLLLGSSLIVMLGVYDDLKDMPALVKLAGQVIIASLLYYYGFRITEITGLFVERIYLGYASYFITVFWIVALINAINLLDGLDGLACGITGIVGIFLFIASVLDGNLVVSLLAAGLVGSCLGFLPFNFYPASIFMGDTGSMFLGMILSLLAIQSHQKSTTFVAILVPMVVLGVPLIDASLAIIRRLVKRKPLFKPDKEHIHHKILEEKPQAKAVLTLYAATCFFGLIALGLRGMQGFYMLIALVIIAWVAFRWVKNSGFVDFQERF